MLQPTNRLTLIDSLRPPVGYVFDAAMAVTYTLDLRALLAAPAALALQRETGTSAEGNQLPVDVLHAIRSHAGQISIFCQAGGTATPPPEKVFSFLEGSVMPVTAPGGGVVHPKVWVIRYQSSADEVDFKMRVLVASRNLTFDPSWDTVVRLDEAIDDGCDLSPISSLFVALCERTVSEPRADHLDRVVSLCADLRDRTFALPAGIEEVSAHIFGFTPKPVPFPQNSDRSLILSPFLSPSFFRDVYPQRVTQLVSRADSIVKVGELETVDRTYWFDDGSNEEESNDILGPALPLRGLHAKAFVFEVGATTHWFLGSANATLAAFRTNIEILLELKGKTKKIGIDAVCSGDDDEPGLEDLFREFVLDEEAVAPDDDGRLLLEDTVRDLSSMVVTAQAAEAAMGWSVTYTTQAHLQVPDGVAVEVWPSTIPGSRQSVAGGRRLEVTFSTPLESISGFLAIEVATSEQAIQFCIPVLIGGLPEDLDAQLMRALIGSSGRFFAYLIALLADTTSEADLLSDVSSVTWSDETWSSKLDHFSQAPVLERMLRSMRTDPVKLLEIRPLVQALESDGILPPEFTELWSTVMAVAANRP